MLGSWTISPISVVTNLSDSINSTSDNFSNVFGDDTNKTNDNEEEGKGKENQVNEKALEEIEGNRLRLEEHNMRKQESIKSEEMKRIGYQNKIKSFELAMQLAANEQKRKEEKRAKSLLVQTSILTRMNEKETEYQIMKKNKAQEMIFMNIEDKLSAQVMIFEAEQKRLRIEREYKDLVASDKLRMAIQLAMEKEMNGMHQEDVYCHEIWSEIQRIEDLRNKIQKDKGWQILIEVATPHGLHRDANFVKLCDIGLGNIDAIALADDLDIREVRVSLL